MSQGASHFLSQYFLVLPLLSNSATLCHTPCNMESVKNIVKEATSSSSPFEQGFKVPITHQDPPGKQGDLPIEPVNTKVPTEDGGLQTYKAAGKLQGKKALITGGDSGIGRAIAILYAMEGADSTIAYLPQEEEDAQETKRQVEKYGRSCHLISADLRTFENNQKVAEFASQEMGTVNILVRMLLSLPGSRLSC